jgi:hypothetical protein
MATAEAVDPGRRPDRTVAFRGSNTRTRGPSQRERTDAELTVTIREIHRDLHGDPGVRRVWAELTPAGQDALKTARPVVDAVVATYFADHLNPGELRRIADILHRLADANPGTSDFDCGL